MKHTTWVMFAIAVLTMGTRIHAAVLVDILDASIAAGSSGDVDVIIQGDLGDLLQIFNFDFRITSTGATRLEFSSPQPDAQLTDPSYTFFGNSLAQINALTVGNVGSDIVPNDKFVGGDSTNDFANVDLGNGPYLLARLHVTTITANAPIAGDEFTIHLEPSADTFFYDVSFTSPNSISFSDGQVTITSASTVPEPTSLLTFVGVFGYAILSRRRIAPSRSSP